MEKLTEQDIKNLILLKKNNESVNEFCKHRFDDWIRSLNKLYKINNIKEG